MLLDAHAPSRVLLVDAASERVRTVADVQLRAEALRGCRGLTFLLVERSLESATDFLGLLEGSCPVALVSAAASASALESLVARYRPERVICPAGWVGAEGYWRIEDSRQQEVWVTDRQTSQPHPNLAVLLTTSGTTGSPKLVRLSSANVASNAAQIGAALALSDRDRGVTSMPLHYSFGMSILTSHALSGGSVLISDQSVIEPGFWETITRHGVSVLGGVPATFAMLRRLGFSGMELPALNTLIQAGGRLDQGLADYFHAVMTRRTGRFFVMYGQTEAAPRMTILASTDYAKRRGSVGTALKGADISIRAENGRVLAPHARGRVFYRGPNVMMGYALTRDDIARGDDHGDLLDTGDLGYLDEDGYLFLTGRAQRFCKLSGARVSLDEVESMLSASADVDAVAAFSVRDDYLKIVVTGVNPLQGAELRGIIARMLKAPLKMINVEVRDELPINSNGKTDYFALLAENPS